MRANSAPGFVEAILSKLRRLLRPRAAEPMPCIAPPADAFALAAAGNVVAQRAMVSQCLNMACATGEMEKGLIWAEMFNRLAMAQGDKLAHYQHVSLLGLLIEDASARGDTASVNAFEVEVIALVAAIADEPGECGEFAASQLEQLVSMAAPEVVAAADDYRKVAFA